ncbi:hypothetical protein Q8F55_008426 [Vanrija albida]|uniref:Uncharacterized protein n=1 Tax=Vanrija albida TaxID=181172 RepID=A0ABR3PQU1_9TREE
MEQNDNYDAYVRLAYLTLEDLRTEHLLGAPDYTADIEELEAAVDWDALVDTSHLEPTEEELREAAAEALLKYRAEKAAREAAQQEAALTWESSPYLNFVAPSSQPTAVDVEGDADHGETTIGGQASDALPTITDGHEAEVGQQEVAENEATPKEHCV